MTVYFNNRLIQTVDEDFHPLNRAFRYGDGVFETVAVIDGRPRLLERHAERLSDGAHILGLNANELVSIDSLATACSLLIGTQPASSQAKIRIYLFRSGEGLYSPDSHDANLLITYSAENWQQIGICRKTGISAQIFNRISPVSRFKTMSALNYVLAGKEKKENGWDEIILLDTERNVSEALASNIFWKKNDTYFTPGLLTGCIEGIMRNWFLDQFKLRGLRVEQVLASSQELIMADSVFTTNSLGIKHISSIGERNFAIDKEIENILGDLK